MPRINQYTDNTTIENDDKMLTYDTQGAATKLTAFSTIWNWIVSKLHALTSSSAALTPSTDRVLMDKNGTMTRVDPASVAKYGIETYNGSTIAGSAQTVKSALDALNSKVSFPISMDSKSETLNNGAFKTITTITLPSAGTYICTADIAFSSQSSEGVRILFIDTTEGTNNNQTNSVLASARADLHKTRLLSVNAETTLYLRGYQTTGSDVTATGKIAYIKIK